MKRDISNITRQLDNYKNNDIIYRKHVVWELLTKDPDIQYLLNRKEKLPLNQYEDPQNPTSEEIAERQRIILYNKSVEVPQILPFMKVNDIQTEVQNFIMFDIEDARQSYTSSLSKNEILTVLCLIHEDDMTTEFGEITRADLLSYCVVDLINWSNDAGLHWELQSNKPAITDTKYYGRTLEFLVRTPNTNNFRTGRMKNSYE